MPSPDPSPSHGPDLVEISGERLALDLEGEPFGEIDSLSPLKAAISMKSTDKELRYLDIVAKEPNFARSVKPLHFPRTRRLRSGMDAAYAVDQIRP